MKKEKETSNSSRIIFGKQCEQMRGRMERQRRKMILVEENEENDWRRKYLLLWWKKTGFFWRTKVFDLRRTETACLNETFQKTVSLPFQLSSSDPLHE